MYLYDYMSTEHAHRQISTYQSIHIIHVVFLLGTVWRWDIHPKEQVNDHHDCNSQASWDHFSWLPPFKAWHLSNLHAGIQQLVHHALQLRIFQLLSQHLNLAGAEKICTHHTSWHHQINTIIIIISISTPNFNPATYLQSCFLPISPCLFQSVILVLGHGVGVEGGVARAIGVVLGPALRLACPSCGGHGGGGGTQGHHGAAAKAAGGAAGGTCGTTQLRRGGGAGGTGSQEGPGARHGGAGQQELGHLRHCWRFGTCESSIFWLRAEMLKYVIEFKSPHCLNCHIVTCTGNALNLQPAPLHPRSSKRTMTTVMLSHPSPLQGHVKIYPVERNLRHWSTFVKFQGCISYDDIPVVGIYIILYIYICVYVLLLCACAHTPLF